jgi:hypothetical protein
MKNVPKTLGYPTKMLMENYHCQVKNDQGSQKNSMLYFIANGNNFFIFQNLGLT